jgi:preprotein translocase subunit YajC
MILASLLLAMGGAPAGADGAAPGGSPMDLFLPLGLTVAIVYFLMLRPQQKRASAHQQMVEGLKKGDHVLTNAGIYGRVLEVDKKTVTLDVGSNMKLRFAKSAVGGIEKPDEEA